MPQAKPGRGDTRRNLQLLLALRRILCADTDVDRTLKSVAVELAQSIADYCIVDTVTNDGAIRRLTIAHADARLHDRLLEARRAFAPSEDGRVARALTKESSTELVTRAKRKRGAVDDSDLDFLEGTPTSYIQVPVFARGEPRALLTCVTTRKKELDQGAVSLLDEVAGWCGLFMEKAVLSETQPRTSSVRPAAPSKRVRSLG